MSEHDHEHEDQHDHEHDHQDHHHDARGGRRERRHHGAAGRSLGDYTRDFFSNWNDSDLPVAKRIAVTFRNRSKAYFVPPFEGCCGNYGEPGC